MFLSCSATIATVLLLVVATSAGAPGAGKSSLLQLVMLRHMPYKGVVSFQLPISAVPPEAAAASITLAPGLPASRPALNGSTSSTTTTMEAAGTAAAAAAAAAAMGPGIQPGGDGWVWASFSWLKDDQQAARACMAMASVTSAGLFR